MNRYFICIFLCYIFQMGFIQLNEDFIFIEPLNDTVAITGHPHRVYRRKRSMEEKVTEKSVPHSHYCGVISGNALSWKGLINAFFFPCLPPFPILPSLCVYPSVHGFIFFFLMWNLSWLMTITYIFLLVLYEVVYFNIKIE